MYYFHCWISQVEMNEVKRCRFLTSFEEQLQKNLSKRGCVSDNQEACKWIWWPVFPLSAKIIHHIRSKRSKKYLFSVRKMEHLFDSLRLVIIIKQNISVFDKKSAQNGSKIESKSEKKLRIFNFRFHFWLIFVSIFGTFSNQLYWVKQLFNWENLWISSVKLKILLRIKYFFPGFCFKNCVKVNAYRNFGRMHFFSWS